MEVFNYKISLARVNHHCRFFQNCNPTTQFIDRKSESSYYDSRIRDRAEIRRAVV